MTLLFNLSNPRKQYNIKYAVKNLTEIFSLVCLNNTLQGVLFVIKLLSVTYRSEITSC